ncbi:MAG: response regulator transcription factor [Anaerolineaceae bacterium]
MSGARVLVVDDDPAILRAVGRALAGRGYSVSSAADGASAVESARLVQPEVILLDLVLPDTDGIDVCRQIRAFSDVPIIVLSAVGDDAKKVEALDEGADDYLTKPFSMEELQARIRAALRRTSSHTGSAQLTAANVALDVETHAVTVDGQPVHLTPKEFRLLQELLQNQGRLQTQRQLLTKVWGMEYIDDAHILRTFIHQLRRKLAAVSADAGALIVNDPGVGYRIEKP